MMMKTQQGQLPVVVTVMMMMLVIITNNTFYVMAQQDESSSSICISPTNTFTVKVNLFASTWGYYEFEECGNLTNPTIGLVRGTTYKFIQADRSNYMHPLGFAYVPDNTNYGSSEAHVVNHNNACTNTNTNNTTTCLSPKYYLNDEFLGSSSTTISTDNDDSLVPNFTTNNNVTSTSADTTTYSKDDGLDLYVPYFLRRILDWSSEGTFHIEVTFDDMNYTDDLFYFCHVHQYMSGRIKLLEDATTNTPLNTEDYPLIEYTYETPGEFDQQCGTYGLDAYQLPNLGCPTRFVCQATDDIGDTISPTLVQYSACIDAMNCHMLHGMTSSFQTNDEVALFIYQMIPHHENAVNMAKGLLKTNVLICPDLLNEEDPDCIMERLLLSIINTQNYQIQIMKQYLLSMNLPLTDDCMVYMRSEPIE